VDQAANTAVVVTDAQLQAGALQWVAGSDGTQDQIRVVAGDPFGDAAAQSFLSPAAMANLLAPAPALFAPMNAGSDSLVTDRANTISLMTLAGG
jgi:hypothetical protein